MGQNATSPRSSFSCGGHVHRCWVDNSTRRHFAGKTASLHRKRRVVARKRIKHVPDILALESSDNVWQDRHLHRKLKLRQTATMNLSGYACLKEVLFGQVDLKTGDRKRDKFLLLWWWTVMVSTTPWPARRPLVLASRTKKSGLDALALKQSHVGRWNNGKLVSFTGTAGRCCNKRL